MILLFILACFGLTQILVSGSIFDRIRPKAKFFHCSMCMGFHVGWLVFLLFWISGVYLFPSIFIGLFIFGSISSGTSYVLERVFGDHGVNICLKDGKNS